MENNYFFDNDTQSVNLYDNNIQKKLKLDNTLFSSVTNGEIRSTFLDLKDDSDFYSDAFFNDYSSQQQAEITPTKRKFKYDGFYQSQFTFNDYAYRNENQMNDTLPTYNLSCFNKFIPINEQNSQCIFDGNLAQQNNQCANIEEPLISSLNTNSDFYDSNSSMFTDFYQTQQPTNIEQISTNCQTMQIESQQPINSHIDSGLPQQQIQQEQSKQNNFSSNIPHFNTENKQKQQFILQKQTNSIKYKDNYQCNNFMLTKNLDYNPEGKLHYIGSIQTPLSKNLKKFSYITENKIFNGNLVAGQRLEISFTDYTKLLMKQEMNQNISDQMYTFIKHEQKYIGYIDHNYSQIWSYLSKHKKIYMVPFFAHEDQQTHIICDIYINQKFLTNGQDQLLEEEMSAFTAKQKESLEQCNKEAAEIFLKIMNFKSITPSIMNEKAQNILNEYKLFSFRYNAFYPKLVISCQKTSQYYGDQIRNLPNRYNDIFSQICSNNKWNNKKPKTEQVEIEISPKYSTILQYTQQDQIQKLKNIPQLNSDSSLDVNENVLMSDVEQSEQQNQQLAKNDNDNSTSIFYLQTQTPLNINTQLHPYQQQGLSWLLYQERRIPNLFISDKEYLNQSLRQIDPRYEEIQLPGGKSIYHNVFTGELRYDIVNENHTYGGILADEMGMGKTLMCIALIQETLKQKNSEFGTLIIAPANLLNQWEEQIIMHSVYNSISVLCLSNKQNRKNDLRNYDVVICSYNSLAQIYQDEDQRSTLFSQNWERIILDEAQRIKNYKSKTAQACYQLKSQQRWCLTGTPIENSLKELYSLLHFLKVQVFGDWSWWSRYTKQNPSLQSQIRLIQKILQPLMLRRTKKQQDENGKEILKLPNKHIQDIEIELFPNERIIYDQIFSQGQTLFQYLSANSKNQFIHIFQILSKLRQFCVHPSLVFSDKNSDLFIDQPEQTPERIAEKIESFLTQFYQKIKMNNLKINSVLNTDEIQILESQLNEDEELQQEEDLHKNNKLTKEQLEKIKLSHNYKEEVLQQIKDGEYKTCQVCLEEIQFHSISSCLHVLCTDCFKNSIKMNNKCPICRKHLELNDILELVCKETQLSMKLNNYQDTQQLTGSKIQKVIEIIESIHAKNEKVVLFSQWLGTLDIIQNHLKQRNILFQRYDGKLNQQQKQSSLKSFDKTMQNSLQINEDDGLINFDNQGILEENEINTMSEETTNQTEVQPTVLLVSLKSGYVGLNLVGANHLILCDSWWNPAVEDQAIDRVYRIGQEKETFIYRIICKNTIEERIQQIHVEKRQLLKQILSQGKSEQIKIGKQDLNFIFS